MNIDEVINGWTFEETIKTAESLMEVEKNMFKWDVIRHLRDFAETYREQLKDYQQLEEQDRLVKLPCKVGTSVYMVAQDCGGDTLDCMRGDCEGCPYLYSFVEENKFEAYMCDDIGKTVFLTQAEAEAKLKELRCNND